MYVISFYVTDKLVNLGNTLQKLNGSVHITSISNIDQTKSLMFFRLLDHDRVNFNITGLLQLFTGFSTHYH